MREQVLVASILNRCEQCGAIAPAGSAECRTCAQAMTPRGGKTKSNALTRYRYSIMRTAQDRPAKLVDMESVIKMTEVGLSTKVLAMQNADRESYGKLNELLKAIAETEVVLEILKHIHIKSAQDTDAYYFYLEQAAKKEPEQRHNDAYAPLPLIR